MRKNPRLKFGPNADEGGKFDPGLIAVFVGSNVHSVLTHMALREPVAVDALTKRDFQAATHAPR